MQNSNYNAVRKFKRPCRADGSVARFSEYFGMNVFDLNVMQHRLSQQDVDTITKVIKTGGKIDAQIAERIAIAVRDWAAERGATHYCHWFQPQTGASAEKHEAFVGFDKIGKAIERFSGKELLQSEPDASSFPNGGCRSTFEARGYTGWDVSSPMFLMENENGMTLYIPSVFVSHYGEALDFKVPLLRSVEALNKEASRTLKLLGENDLNVSNINIGPEQEFFLINKNLADKRKDILLSGRTIFGKKPAKGQELEDHYFANIPPRVYAFMQETEVELYKVGVPMKTRHNEVAPKQFEFAPIYETANIATDHNQLLMNVLKIVADKHGFTVLLHEKPFAGINGSGKHVNWSLEDSTGRNLFEPGFTPHQNIVFLTFLVGVLEAIYEHGDVIRASVASAGNDHRLGANEAPPAIMSVFLGEYLEKILNALENGVIVTSSGEKAVLDLGIDRLQHMVADNTDRNRTSPFAFTGNKFEFRAVGSSAAIGFPITILNGAMASSLNNINIELEKHIIDGVCPLDKILDVLRKFVIKTKIIRFGGNGYSEEWKNEAKQRGLGNYSTTPEALEAISLHHKNKFLVEYKIFSTNDIENRLAVQYERYIKQRLIEINLALEMVNTSILPVAFKYYQEISQLSNTSHANISKRILTKVGEFTAAVDTLVAALELNTNKIIDNEAFEHKNLLKTAKLIANQLMPMFDNLRKAVDDLESVIPDQLWPYPHYTELLFDVNI